MLMNAVSVDLEDWPQSTLDNNLPITTRVVDNTERLLALFAQHNTRATFFVLGLVAEKFPDLIRKIANAGHAIGSHGYGHQQIFHLSPEEFREDIRRSVSLIADITGQAPKGYRAPDFSVIESTIWALDILQEEGFEYDSSIFPFAGPRYGIAGAPRFPHEVRENLIEFPLSTLEIGGRRLPVVGGGYFRLFPYLVTHSAVRHINQEGHPAILYLHPYEIDPNEMQEIEFDVPMRLGITQSLNRRSVEHKLHRLFREFEFTTIEEVLANDRQASH